jgi:hypothetical protein
MIVIYDQSIFIVQGTALSLAAATEKKKSYNVETSSKVLILSRVNMMRV